MRKMIVVAVREYQAAVRTKAFLVTLVALPLLWAGMIVAQVALKDRVDTTDKRFAILDESGVLYDAVAAAAAERNEGPDITNETGKQVKPRFLIERVASGGGSPEEALLELSERVRKEEFFGFVIVGPDAVQPGTDAQRAAIAYHSNSPTYDDFQHWVSIPLNARIQELRFRAAGLDPDVVDEATRRARVVNLGLVSLDEAGHITEAAQTSRIANFFVPFAMVMLMFMVVTIGAQPLVNTVMEEKMQRIAEVLLGSVPPFQLMMGKLLGTVGVSLTIGTAYLVGAYLAVRQAGYAGLFPTHVVCWFFVFQAVAVLMFGSLYIAVGAAVTDLKEAQSLILPLMIPIMVPLVAWPNVAREPSATFAVVLSLIPPFTPMLMLVRQAVPPGVPLWQPLLGIALTLLATVACVLAASRVFRVGILMQGKGANFREMLRWVVQG